MRSGSPLHLNGSFLIILCVAGASGMSVAACVGNEPLPADADGGPDGSVNPNEAGAGTPDGSSGSDGSGTADGGSDSAPPRDSGGGGDASDAVAQETGGPWTPATLDQQNKLALWLEASSGNLVISSGTVGTWRDLSKNHNDATNTQGGPNVTAGAINGHDAVHFVGTTGVTLDITDATSLQFGMDQVYIAAVTRAPVGQPASFFSKITTTFNTGTFHYASGLEFYVTQATTDAGATIVFPAAHIAPTGSEILWGDSVLEDSAFHFVAFRRTTAFAIELTVDDQPARSASTGDWDVSLPGVAAHVGAFKYNTFSPPADFSIAEMVILHDGGPIADADVAALHTYLKAKYAL